MSSPHPPLSKPQIKFLRAQAHSLKPVIMVGANGLTESLLEELNNTLEHHELIKVKVRSEEREEKHEIIDKILKQMLAHKIHVIGHNLVIYRAAKSPKLVLPKK